MQNEIISLGQESVPLDEVKAALQHALGAMEELLDRLEQTPVIQVATADEAQVRRVVRMCITRGDQDFAMDEFFELYAEICGCMGLVPVPAKVARKILPKVMLEVHGIRQVHSLRRVGKYQRGFRGVGAVRPPGS
jgi:hypothetical protein